MITLGAYGESRAVLERTGTMNDGGIRRAGLAAILGGAILVTNLLLYEGLGLAEVTASSSLVATLNNGSLLVAWALLLWGLLGLRAYGGNGRGRLRTAGIGLMGTGLALATIGFVLQTFAPLVGLMGLANLGGMTIALGVLAFIPVEAIVQGTGLFRTGAVSRLGATLMIAAGPSILTTMLVGGAVPPVVEGCSSPVRSGRRGSPSATASGLRRSGQPPNRTRRYKRPNVPVLDDRRFEERSTWPT